MDFLQLAGERYSVRSFCDRPVEQEKVDRILRAGQIAPTAHNYQPQRIYVLRSAEALEKLQKCKEFHFGETLAFIICSDKSVSWKRAYDGKDSGDVDTSIVATHMMLEAWEQGIGSTWVMYFKPDAVRAEFALPENEEPVSILVMGYASENARPSPYHKDKKDLAETVTVL